MAAAIAARTPAAAALAAIGHASGRIELVWNTKADPDPVPETAELILDAAQDLAAEVAGVVVIGGSRLLPATRGTEADDLRLLLP